jgi:mannose-1-phosphate guanylyltransferase
METYNTEFYVEVSETRWGEFFVITEDEEGELKTKLKILEVNANENLSYQKHEKRAENWTVLRGSGVVIVNEELYPLAIGHSISIPVGFWHCLKAGEEGISIAEVQVGTECEEDDIERMFYDWQDILDYVKEAK